MSDRPKFWSTVVGLITFLMGGVCAVSRRLRSMGEVGLPATYGSAAWRRAKPEDDDWQSGKLG